MGFPGLSEFFRSLFEKGRMSQTGPKKCFIYHKIEKNTPILIQQSIAYAYIELPVNYILLESLYAIDLCHIC